MSNTKGVCIGACAERRHAELRVFRFARSSFTTEGRIKTHHGRAILAWRVFQAMGQQAHSGLAQITYTFGNAGQKRQQGTFKGVGEHISYIKPTGQGARHLAPRR